MSTEALNAQIDALREMSRQHEQMLNTAQHRIDELEFRLKFPKIMTARQVCDFLRISERQFYEWKRAGDTPPAMYWSERTVRYDLDAVMAWAKDKEVGQA